MLPSTDIMNVRPIHPVRRNAQALQKLKLQHARAAGFVVPHLMADPDNEHFVERELNQLFKYICVYPHRDTLMGHSQDDTLLGYTHFDKLLGYVRQRYWRKSDVFPEATGMRGPMLKNLHARWLDSVSRQWYVAELVVLDDLDQPARNYIFGVLLNRSFASDEGVPRTVNIVLHENDPFLDVIQWYGFVPVGEPAEKSGASGLWQRYRRRADK